MKITTKTNGYEVKKELKKMIKSFENASKKLFDKNIEEIEHFYYGDKLDMIRIKLKNGNYGDFNLGSKSVHYVGCSCSHEENKNFEMLTYNDNFYKGKLLEIA